ncbi:short-chain dehydrogenase [Nonomuraea thailandensis]
MPEAEPGCASLSLGKAGGRTLVTLLGQEHGPSGVHVDGPAAAVTAFDPDDIAAHHWRLRIRPRDQWQREVLHSGRAGVAVTVASTSEAEGDQR